MLEACDLLAQLLYLVLEVFLPAAHAGVAGLESVAETVDRPDRRLPYEVSRTAETA